MRRIGPRVAGAVLLVTFAVAVVARGSAAPAGPAPPILRAVDEHPVLFDVEPDDVLGFWGEIRNFTTGAKLGSYRATCVRLGPQNDIRLSCNVILSFDDGSSLTVQGLVDRPAPGHDLFASPSASSSSTRKLAVTGGTVTYNGRQGYADPQGGGKIVIGLL